MNFKRTLVRKTIDTIVCSMYNYYQKHKDLSDGVGAPFEDRSMYII